MAVARLRMSVREAVAVVVRENEDLLFCPECGARATDWRERYTLFRHLHRPEPRDGYVWDQCYRCVACGFIFGHPHAASVESE